MPTKDQNTLATAFLLAAGAGLVYAAYESGRATQAISDAKALMRRQGVVPEDEPPTEEEDRVVVHG